MPDVVVDDNFEDLTGNDKKQKKSRKNKGNAEAPQDPSEAVADAEDTGDKKKKRKEKAVKADKTKDKDSAGSSHVLLRILVIVIPVLLIGGFVFEEIYWNMLGVRDWTCEALISAVSWLDPSTASVRRTQWLRGKELDELEAELDARDIERQSDFAARKADLDEREDAIVLKEEEIEQRIEAIIQHEQDMLTAEIEISRTPVYRRELDEQEQADLESLSATYAAMAPDAAADILMRMYDLSDVAAIVYYMSDKKAAEILSAMDPAYAANLTQLFLS